MNLLLNAMVNDLNNHFGSMSNAMSHHPRLFNSYALQTQRPKSPLIGQAINVCKTYGHIRSLSLSLSLPHSHCILLIVSSLGASIEIEIEFAITPGFAVQHMHSHSHSPPHSTDDQEPKMDELNGTQIHFRRACLPSATSAILVVLSMKKDMIK